MMNQSAYAGPFAAYDFVRYYLNAVTHDKMSTLEIGCGSMQYAPYVRGVYHGLDSSASRYVSKSPYYAGYLEEVTLPENTYDVIFGVAVFYYMTDPVSNFIKLKNALKKNGKIVLFDYQKKT